MTPYFFGYGSLVNRATHDYVHAHPARISGWRRAWRHVEGRSVALFCRGAKPVFLGDGLPFLPIDEPVDFILFPFNSVDVEIFSGVFPREKILAAFVGILGPLVAEVKGANGAITATH